MRVISRGVARILPLLEFQKYGKIAVCNFDYTLPLSQRGRCAKCGREVTVNPTFSDMPTKVCVLCAPEITE